MMKKLLVNLLSANIGLNDIKKIKKPYSKKRFSQSIIKIQLMKSSILFLTLFVVSSYAMAQSDSASMAKMVKESGIDPTKVQSRGSYSFIISDPSGSSISIFNKLSFNLGINRWSFNGKYELTSRYTNNAEGAFSTGSGDLKFSALNAFFVKGKHALAASAELTFPLGKPGYGLQYFALMPALTYSFTINPSLIFAVQPQYLFNLVKGDNYPQLSILTTRIFIAKFTKSGYFFVFEPRPIYNFTTNQFDLILAPIIGKALGKGFNLVFFAEFPTTKRFWDQTGPLYTAGISKSF